MTFIKFHVTFFLTMLAQLVDHPLFCQNSHNYGYLIECFKNSNIDSSQREIKGIGNVETINLESVEQEETGLTYYEIPLRKKNKPTSKLTQLVADQYIQTGITTQE